MKKHCGMYYTTKHIETSSRNNSTPQKKYAWTIYNENRKKEISSLDDDGVWPTMYDSKIEAALHAEEAIEDNYV